MFSLANTTKITTDACYKCNCCTQHIQVKLPIWTLIEMSRLKSSLLTHDISIEKFVWLDPDFLKLISWYQSIILSLMTQNEISCKRIIDLERQLSNLNIN